MRTSLRLAPFAVLAAAALLSGAALAGSRMTYTDHATADTEAEARQKVYDQLAGWCDRTGREKTDFRVISVDWNANDFGPWVAVWAEITCVDR